MLEPVQPTFPINMSFADLSAGRNLHRRRMTVSRADLATRINYHRFPLEPLLSAKTTAPSPTPRLRSDSHTNCCCACYWAEPVRNCPLSFSWGIRLEIGRDTISPSQPRQLEMRLRVFASAGISSRQLLAVDHEFQENFAFSFIEYALCNPANLVRPAVKFGDGSFVWHIV